MIIRKIFFEIDKPNYQRRRELYFQKEIKIVIVTKFKRSLGFFQREKNSFYTKINEESYFQKEIKIVLVEDFVNEKTFKSDLQERI